MRTDHSPFHKLDDAGRVLARDAATWSQTYDVATGLVWANESLQGEDHASCMAKASAYRVGQFAFRAPTRVELLTLIRDDGIDPAADHEFFGNLPSRWHWSSSPVVGWPEGAWGVGFGLGLVSLHGRAYGGFVRPVRAARPRQSLAVGDLVLADVAAS
jgi:hypothetical protein